MDYSKYTLEAFFDEYLADCGLSQIVIKGTKQYKNMQDIFFQISALMLSKVSQISKLSDEDNKRIVNGFGEELLRHHMMQNLNQN